MQESDIKEELDIDPFTPLRLHLVSGKTLDIVRADAAWPLKNRLLVFVNPSKRGTGAESYDVVAYHNIERLEQLPIGKRNGGKRRPA